MKKLNAQERMEIFKLAAMAASARSGGVLGLDVLIPSYYDEFKTRYSEIKEKEEEEQISSRPSIYS